MKYVVLLLVAFLYPPPALQTAEQKAKPKPAAKAPAPKTQEQKDRDEVWCIDNELAAIEKQVDATPLGKKRKVLLDQQMVVCNRLYPPAKKAPLKPVPAAKSIKHEITIAGFHTLMMPGGDCGDSKIRRGGLWLTLDFKPAIQANERAWFSINPDGNGDTQWSGKAYGNCKEQMKHKDEPGEDCCSTLPVSGKRGKTWMSVGRPYAVNSVVIQFFKKKGKTGPTLNSLTIDGKTVPIPSEK